MASQWVVNASPLILLCKIDQQSLLLDLADDIVVPKSVVDEINAGPVDDPARRFLTTDPLHIVEVAAQPLVERWDLGAGETAVLSYAYMNAGWTAVVDDGAARRCARALGLPTNGTLGIVLRARHVGFIPAAAPVLKSLLDQGMRLREEVIREALARVVDETWP